MSKVCILVHLLSSVSFFLGSVDAQRPCSDDTLDDTIRNFIRWEDEQLIKVDS